jgi:hypothetical protein
MMTKMVDRVFVDAMLSLLHLLFLLLLLLPLLLHYNYHVHHQYYLHDDVGGAYRR